MTILNRILNQKQLIGVYSKSGELINPYSLIDKRNACLEIYSYLSTIKVKSTESNLYLIFPLKIHVFRNKTNDSVDINFSDIILTVNNDIINVKKYKLSEIIGEIENKYYCKSYKVFIRENSQNLPEEELQIDLAETAIAISAKRLALYVHTQMNKCIFDLGI